MIYRFDSVAGLPIRRDLSVNDIQMSVLMGLSFAIFHTIAGMGLKPYREARETLASWGERQGQPG